MMSDLLRNAEQYVFDLLKDKLKSDYTYHNFFHTQYVVSKLKELLKEEKVTDEEAKLLKLAAWFHDTGYIEGPDGHEERSAQIAEAYLKEKDLPQNEIDEVKELIVATTLTRVPRNKHEMILKDADTANLGEKIFDQLTTLMRRECELCAGTTISDAEWDEENYEFLTKRHKFYTSYAKENWQPRKLKHAIEIEERIRQQQMDKDKTKEESKEEKRLKALDKPGRGIETLFRVTLNNHTRLSDIADSKANILLSVNAIIISIALSTLLPKLSLRGNHYLIFPTLTMLTFSVASIIFAIMATKPKITSRGEFTEKDIRKRKVNFLFFGDFHRMSLEDYQDGMLDIITDNDYLYRSLMRDLYYLGLVLNRKYRLLSLTYWVFLIGTILTVIAFTVAFSENAQFIDIFE